MRRLNKKQKQILPEPPIFPARALSVTFAFTLTTCFFNIPPGFGAEAKEELKKYTKALENDPDSAVLHYNLGCVYYGRKDYEKAVESLYKGLLRADKSLELKSQYNLGNSKYQLGRLSEGKKKLEEAASLYKEALAHYKNVIEKDPRDKEAKYNYELVQKDLKRLLEKIKNQPKKEGEGKEDKEKQNKGKPDKKNQGQKQPEQDQAGPPPDKKDSASGPKEQEGQKAAAPQDENKEMTEEEAKMLLESFAQRERQRSIQEKQKERITYSQEYNDW